MARCPAHEDSSPSLHVAEGEAGRALVKCHAGCGFLAVVAAIGLEAADCFSEPLNGQANGRHGRPTSATRETVYAIRDASGALVAEHVRIETAEGKRFVWMRNGKSGLAGLPVVDLPLYRIETIAARPDGDVIVTEGEKACDELVKRGFLAVATVTGADEKGRRPSDAVLSALRGRRVVLWPDNDGPGRVHMNAVTAPLANGVASEIRVVDWKEAPPRGDAADFTGTDDELRALIGAATRVHGRPPLAWRDLERVAADAKAKPRRYVCRAIGLATRTVACLGGEAKGGKSEFMAAFIAAATQGREFLGETIDATPVILVTEEGDHDLAEKLGERYRAVRPCVLVLSRDVVGVPPTWGETIVEAVAKAKETNAALLVIDTLSFWAGLEGDEERSEGVMRQRLLALQPARDAGIAVVVVHHSVKARDVEGIAALRGSGAIAGAVESVAIFRRVSKDPLNPKRKIELFSRISPCTTVVVERVTPADADAHFKVVESDEDKPAGGVSVDRRIVDAVSRVGGWMTSKQIRLATGIGERTLDSRLPRLVEGRQPALVRIGNGSKSAPFQYALPGTPGPSK